MTIDIQSVTPAQVLRAYSGKKGCMCGCKGKYSVNPARREEAAKACGYAIDDEDCDAAQVVRILRTIQANESDVEVDEAGDWMAVDIGARTFAVYLR